MITVPQVCRDLGLQTDKNVMWSVGDIMQKRYADQFGHQPHKDNRPKTNGRGSHCFALYPESWRDAIADEIKKYQTISTRQTDLFK